MDYNRPLLQVPLEALRTHLKETRQTIERQLASLVTELKAQADVEPGRRLDPELAATVISRVAALRAQLGDLRLKYAAISDLIEARTRFVTDADRRLQIPDEKDAALDELLHLHIVEHYLEKGDVALARSLCPPEMEAMLDWQVHERRSEIGQALRDHNPEPCLQWCHEQSSFFKKTRLMLELHCRILHMREVAAQGDFVTAIKLAHELVAQSDDVAFKTNELLRAVPAMTAAIMGSVRDTNLQNSWDDLATEFYAVYDQRYSRESHMSLMERISAGLFATHTTSCKVRDFGGRQFECPSCSRELGPLAQRLPTPHHSHSVLDPDCVLLGNGRVVGLARAKAAAGDRGLVADPETGTVFPTYEKVYTL